MTVIALALEAGSADRTLPRALAEHLHLDLVDHRPLERQSACETDFAAGKLRNPISWPARSNTCASGAPGLADATCDAAQRGNVLIVGCCVPAILQPIASARVLVRAPMTAREINVMTQLAYRDVRSARLEIESEDALIARFARRMLGKDWRDPDYYDLTINAERVSSDMLLAALVGLTLNPGFQQASRLRHGIADRSNRFCCKSVQRISWDNRRAVTIEGDEIRLGKTDTNEDAIAKIERHLRGQPGEARAEPFCWRRDI